MPSESAEITTLLGPFFARAILELAATAILARFDPARVLFVGMVQTRPSYDFNVRVQGAVQWTGDILPRKTPQQPWLPESKFDDEARALLGVHYEHFFWREAFEQLTTEADVSVGGDWLYRLRLIEPDALLPRYRSEMARLYSALSKGVHHEFLVPPSIPYDPLTVLNYANEVIEHVSNLALISATSSASHYREPLSVALERYEDIQSHLILV